MLGESRQWVRLAVTFFLGIIVGAGVIALTGRVQPAPIIIEPAPPTPAPVPTATAAPIRIFINGQVAVPDVYELPPGSLVKAAIEAAGGFTIEANTAVVNLAQPLQDGMQVYVPAMAEENLVLDVIIAPSAEENGQLDTAVGASSGGLVNINTATIEMLDTLPGIGPSTAQNIVDHRDSNGPFATIESIMDVSGIGEAKFATIQTLITIDGE